MEHFTLDATTFARFRKRYDDWMAAGMPNVDARLAAVLPLFCKMRKILPLFSRAGTSNKGIHAKKMKEVYLVLLVEDGGLDELADFYKRVEAKLQPHCDNDCYIQVGLTMRARPFRWDYVEEQHLYYTHTLNFWPVQSDEQLDAVLGVVKEALIEMGGVSTDADTVLNVLTEMEEMMHCTTPSNYRNSIDGNVPKELTELKVPALLRIKLLCRMIDFKDVPASMYGTYRKLIAAKYPILF